MSNWKSVLRHLARSETAVSTIEYALLASLIAMVCVVTVFGMGGNLSTLYQTVCNAVPGAAAC